MGIADRDYMRERVTRRGGVFRPGARHVNPRRQGLQPVGLVAVVIAAVSIYHHIDVNGSPPRMRHASRPFVQPAMSAPLTVPTIMDVPITPVQKFPVSGTTQWFRENDPRQRTGILRVMDTSDLIGDKVVRIRDAFGTPVAQTYIRNQEGAQLLLPLGRYDMTIAVGNGWHGPDKQFGGAARYLQTNGLEVIAGEVNYRILPNGQGGEPLEPIAADAF